MKKAKTVLVPTIINLLFLLYTEGLKTTHVQHDSKHWYLFSEPAWRFYIPDKWKYFITLMQQNPCKSDLPQNWSQNPFQSKTSLHFQVVSSQFYDFKPISLFFFLCGWIHYFAAIVTIDVAHGASSGCWYNNDLKNENIYQTKAATAAIFFPAWQFSDTLFCQTRV